MNAPASRHTVRRQTVELSAPDESTARRLHARVSSLQESSLAAIIERCCSIAGHPERIDRITHLDVDLGRLDPHDFERSFEERLSERLPVALEEQLAAGRPVVRGVIVNDEFRADAIGDPTTAMPITGERGHDPTGSGIELLVHFLRSGTLPWWADPQQPRVLADAVRDVLAAGPTGPAVLSSVLIESPALVLRLVEAIDDLVLDELVTGMAPGIAEVMRPSELIAPLAASPVLEARPARRRRSLAWAALLESALVEAGSSASQFVRHTLVRLARAAGVDRDELATGALDAVRRIASPSAVLAAIESASPSTFRDEPPLIAADPTLTDAARAQPNGPALDTRPTENPPRRGAHSDHAEEAPKRDLATPATTAGTTPAPEGTAGRSPHDGRGRGEGGGEASPTSASTDTASTSESSEAQFTSESTETALTSESMETPGHRSDAAAPVAAADRPPDLGDTATARPESASLGDLTRSALDLSFSDSDRAEIHSGGLAILGPFLDRFLQRLALVDDGGRFVDPDAQHRAVGLFHFLATGDRTPTEYLATLEKVLCGMRIEDVLDFGDPVTDSEAEECSDLLVAVIDHAGVFGEISPEGFRGTFLFRRGMLAAEDGAWALRVEREPHDVLIDRLPWGFEWLAFRWMRAPMRIEW